MNRKDLIRHLETHGCLLWREGKKHTIYHNPANGAFSTIPRHRVIKKFLAHKICDDLGVPRPQYGG
jgi:mRNA interferase HicA